MNARFLSRLDDAHVLLADGAMGTNLFAAGLQTGDAPELWNVEHAERVEALHTAFVKAGSDIVLTNSFGGTHYRLALHDAGSRVRELNVAAARIARSAIERHSTRADEHRPLVAGSMGPTGEILAPNGSVSIEQARDAFREQAEALAEGGVDLLWIETISSAEEIEAAVLGASGLGLPVVYTVSIDTNGRTMMGLTPADTVSIVNRLDAGVQAMGTNCGVGAAEVVAAIRNFKTAFEASGTTLPLVAKANCGIPEWKGDSIVYNGTPDLMAEYAVMAADAGARIIGGCCGTTPEHVAAMRQALDQRTPGPAPEADTIVKILGDISTGALAQMAGDLSVEGGSASGGNARNTRRRRRRPS
jgi:5-methyltetrahydrofolate--homocysteine methyltransferase